MFPNRKKKAINYVGKNFFLLVMLKIFFLVVFRWQKKYYIFEMTIRETQWTGT
jgi:hypothetical protein